MRRNSRGSWQLSAHVRNFALMCVLDGCDTLAVLLQRQPMKAALPRQSENVPESPGTLRRWQEGGKQFPPWQYRATALVTIRDNLCVPDPRGFLQDYTAPASPRSRCRMLGNLWRLPVCRFLLFAILVLHEALQVSAVEGHAWYPPVSCPRFEARFRPDGSRPLLRARSWWLRSGVQWTPTSLAA